MSDPFRTRDHVPDFDRHVAAYAARSAATRARLPMRANIAYGPGAGETLDLFLPAPGRATGAVHMFIHGGYWRMFGKEDFSFIADTVTEAGAIAVIVDYALMPAVRMAAIVDQIDRAAGWVAANIAAHGGDAAQLTISGHSAGAHLGALLLSDLARDYTVKGILLLSGIYDLAPLQASFLKDLIAITDDEVIRFSPMGRSYGRVSDVHLLVGDAETAPFHAQAAAFTAHLAESGVPARRSSIAGADHMSLVADLGTPGTPAARALIECLGAGRGAS